MKTTKRLPKIGKYGIKGITGIGVLNGIFHLSAPYDSNGKIFVEMDDFTWERMTKAQAKRQKKTIIPCFMCKNPAVSLDHLYPYHQEMNRCAKHYSTKLK